MVLFGLTTTEKKKKKKKKRSKTKRNKMIVCAKGDHLCYFVTGTKIQGLVKYRSMSHDSLELSRTNLKRKSKERYGQTMKTAFFTASFKVENATSESLLHCALSTYLPLGYLIQVHQKRGEQHLW